MKQIKFKQLATFGLCCSLLGNSLTGVTAVAETVTIESSPTAESTKESPKERTETSETTTETSREEATQETEKQEKVTEAAQVEVEQEETETSEVIQPNPVPLPASGIGVRAGNLETMVPQLEALFRFKKYYPTSAILTLPAVTVGLDLVSDGEENIVISDFSLTSLVEHVYVSNGNTAVRNSDPIIVPSATGFDVTIPSVRIQWNIYSEEKRTLKAANLTVPKYIENISVSSPKGMVAFTSEDEDIYNSPGEFTAIKSSDGSYRIEKPKVAGYIDEGLFQFYKSQIKPTIPDAALRSFVALPPENLKLKLVHKKVTENFKDVNGTAIPAPTDFTQGKQTSITNNDYTFTQDGTLPDTYVADGKTYKFKGWYKGNTKPATLETSKTPSYKVTYDDNDDLNVVYEEVTNKDYNFPSRAVSFQFLDEAGTIIPPTPFTITTDLQQEINSTYTKLESITGTDSGNTKQVTIPAKTIKADVSLGGVNSYGTTNTRITIPKFYENISVYTGNDHTQATLNRYSTADNTLIDKPASNAPLYYGLNKMTTTQFKVNEYDTTTTIPEQSEYLYNRLYVSGASRLFNSYVTPVGTIYYQLTNRKVTENFVDGTGAKITAPTGFKQGKQTVIDSDDFTYTQEGTLPYIYKINNKPYVLKGWYKGKEKPAKLNQITKEKPNISYPVSYDDQDDVTVVYDELKLAGNTIQFGFVNEQGNYIPPTSKFNVSTDIGEVTNATYTKLQTVNSTINGNYLSLTIPAYNPTGGIGQGDVYYGSRNSIVTIPNYYKPPTLTPPSNYNGTVYPTATGVADYHDAATYAYLPSRLNLTPVSGSQTNYRLPQAIWTDEETKTAFSSLYKMNATSTSETTMGLAEIYATGTVNYYLENRRVTENFVDDTGAKITPPADFTQGKQTVIDSDNFTYTSAKALPASYTADGKSYVLQGWYKGTEKPTTLETSKTPSYSVTYNDQDDLTVVYKEGTISADLTMRGAVDVIDNGAPMEYWEVLLKNTGEVPLTSIKIKPTTDWMSGISAPTELFILGTGQNAKARPITKEQWEAGFEIPLDSSLPVGGQLTINLIGTKVTGQPGQVLEAAVEVTGNFGNLKASDTVRIKDLDQEIKEPTGEGFISVPTFDFGQVGVASATKQHGLKKAADYYGNGTRNPYVRISKTQPNWSLTAQLSQPKSATDSLPTATRLLLGAAPVSSFSNYNQPTELKNAIGTTNAIHLTANNAATSIIANQQFTGSDVYQLDFTFDNIKLEVPANQGTAGQQYQAAVTWNLVTGP
ncbi:WxL domain-containing protein [Enterococcus faecalis]|uniref:WxL domain-containing protein n=1 Tax=Enterococcus faecalis TaxID=1351 RepID=UPI0012E26799|nr:WxL domain-containing protein [Enterococcus faecalis]EHT2878960.1 WxL domain-containing protein [Enterococcus faecalis]MUO22894.1 WxL domain-containing protein [Enterococcus faecalis]